MMMLYITAFLVSFELIDFVIIFDLIRYTLSLLMNQLVCLQLQFLMRMLQDIALSGITMGSISTALIQHQFFFHDF